MTPWFIATEPFTPEDGARWDKYIRWSGLSQLREVVSLDGMLCTPLMREVQDDYWPHIVQENFMLQYFVSFEFLMSRVNRIARKNVLCVFRDPAERPVPPAFAPFEFLGYDLVDVNGGVSALTNCGGWPEIFANHELSDCGLLPELRRAVEVQALLRSRYPDEHHADCHVWAVFRMK